MNNMTRLDVLSRLPEKARDIIRDWEARREENALSRMAHPAAQEDLERLDALAKKMIRDMLSLYYRESELDAAVAALENRNEG